MTFPRTLGALVVAFALTAPVMAAPLPASAELTIKLAIADPGVANPAKPYVAVWLEGTDKKPASQWALWTGNQTDWLKDIRTWWRKFGRYHAKDIDGYSSATRAIGEYTLRPELTDLAGAALEQGQYTLYIEAVREHGGRDIVRQKITLGEDAQHFSLPAKAELGAITIDYKI